MPADDEHRVDQTSAADDIDRLVTLGDLDGLVRYVDRSCTARDWDALVEVRARCRGAISTGRQLWPAVTLAEYRLALHAPGAYAAAVVEEGAGWFAPGPLSEVAASRHAWAELAPHLPPGPLATFTAHERVLRGEELTADPHLDAQVLDLPGVLQEWEPSYALAEYSDDGGRFDPPVVPAVFVVALPERPEPVPDADAIDALRGLVAPWTVESNGRVDAVAVDGDHLVAIAALGVPMARAGVLTPADALAWLAWAGASGGAHGRRRGAARGRFEAWWVATTLAGLDWPPHPDELGDAVQELRWWWWDAHEPLTGWRVQLAVHDPTDGMAWALAASDAR